ncbi:MAG: DUF4238 domain-containing protein [Agathobacter sp.]|nr:DUF4238 domain-containing protein [Agathobacter sp.]
MGDNITKEQHFVPVMYLKRFTYDEKQEQCFTLNKKKEIHPQPINTICKKHYYYELRKVDGSIHKLNFLEKEFFGPLETLAEPLLRRVCALIDEQATNSIINDFPSTDLIDFLALMINRNPHTIKMAPYFAQKMGITIDCPNNKNAALLFSLSQIPEFSKSLLDRYNIILHSNKTSTPFVTAEYPFAVISATANSQHGFFYFPLSSQHLLILEPKLLVGNLPIRVMKSDESFVHTVNNYISQNLQKCGLIIAANKHVLENLRDNK